MFAPVGLNVLSVAGGAAGNMLLQAYLCDAGALAAAPPVHGAVSLPLACVVAFVPYAANTGLTRTGAGDRSPPKYNRTFHNTPPPLTEVCTQTQRIGAQATVPCQLYAHKRRHTRDIRPNVMQFDFFHPETASCSDMSDGRPPILSSAPWVAGAPNAAPLQRQFSQAIAPQYSYVGWFGGVVRAVCPRPRGIFV